MIRGILTKLYTLVESILMSNLLQINNHFRMGFICLGRFWLSWMNCFWNISIWFAEFLFALSCCLTRITPIFLYIQFVLYTFFTGAVQFLTKYNMFSNSFYNESFQLKYTKRSFRLIAHHTRMNSWGYRCKLIVSATPVPYCRLKSHRNYQLTFQVLISSWVFILRVSLKLDLTSATL